MRLWVTRGKGDEDRGIFPSLENLLVHPVTRALLSGSRARKREPAQRCGLAWGERERA